ncbi:MAG: acyltransferase [candidate division KSB1 bacterium]|nr:acyltransferase [candidate division KSB1 bacterium]
MIRALNRLILYLLRQLISLIYLSYGKYLDVIYNLYGIEGINRVMLRTRFPKYVLTKFGAKIGEGTIVYPHVFMDTDGKDYSNLIVGSKCRIMRDTFLDLTAPIEVGDTALIGNRVSIFTHLNLGDSDLKKVYPTVSGSVKIGKGASISTGSIVLHGVTIGEYSIVGAGSVISRDIPPYSVAVGHPARVVKRLDLEGTNHKDNKSG